MAATRCEMVVTGAQRAHYKHSNTRRYVTIERASADAQVFHCPTASLRDMQEQDFAITRLGPDKYVFCYGFAMICYDFLRFTASKAIFRKRNLVYAHCPEAT